MNTLIRILLTLLTLVFVLTSCTSRKNEAERKNIIPEKKMVDIITDLYITDGLVILPIVHQWYDTKKDTLAAYIDVINNYGYSKDDFDKTMRFYFIKKPKQLMKIYEQALARLSEMETRYDQEAAQLQLILTNYWKRPQVLASPAVKSDTADFNVKLDVWKIYYFSFRVTVFPDDQSINPRPLIYLCHADSIDSGKRFYIKTMDYIKDGMPHEYRYFIHDPNEARLQLMGNLFGAGNDPSLEKHFIIDNISILD